MAQAPNVRYLHEGDLANTGSTPTPRVTNRIMQLLQAYLTPGGGGVNLVKDIVGAVAVASGGAYDSTAKTATWPGTGGGGGGGTVPDQTIIPAVDVAASRNVAASDMGSVLRANNDQTPVTLTIPLTANVPAFSETFTAADNSPWPSARWSQNNSTSQVVVGNRGRLITPAAAYGALNTVVAFHAERVDFDFYVDVIAGAPTAEQYIDIGWRCQSDGALGGGAFYNGYRINWNPAAGGFDVCRQNNGVKTVLAEVPFPYPTGGARFHIQHLGSNNPQVKAYAITALQEPAGWTSVTDPSPYLTAGVLSLLATSGGDATSRNVDFDNFSLLGSSGAVVSIPAQSVFSVAAVGSAATTVTAATGVTLRPSQTVTVPQFTEKSFRQDRLGDWWAQ